MSCSSCDDLRRQLREAREEVEAWKAGARDEAEAGNAADRLNRWKRAIDSGRTSSVMALMLMVDAPDRVVTAAQILTRTRLIRCGHADDVAGLRAGAVHIHYARKALAALGCDGVIETCWGLGWMVSGEAAQRVRTLMGDEA